jgi:hypothetical protein
MSDPLSLRWRLRPGMCRFQIVSVGTTIGCRFGEIKQTHGVVRRAANSPEKAASRGPIRAAGGQPLEEEMQPLRQAYAPETMVQIIPIDAYTPVQLPEWIDAVPDLIAVVTICARIADSS